MLLKNDHSREDAAETEAQPPSENASVYRHDVRMALYAGFSHAEVAFMLDLDTPSPRVKDEWEDLL